MASLRDDGPLDNFAVAMAALYRAWPETYRPENYAGLA